MRYTVPMKWALDGLEQISDNSSAIVRAGAIGYAAFFIAYGVLASTGALAIELAESLQFAVYIIGALWLAYAWWQYAHETANPISLTVRLVLYHGLSAWYILAISGIDSSLTYMWALLIVASCMYFGLRGVIYSVSGLILVLVYGIVSEPLSGVALVELYFAGLATAFIGGVTALTIQQTLRDQRELDSSHSQAQLQRDRTTTLINNLTDAVISTDQNGKILLYNAAVMNLLDTNTGLDRKNIDDILQLRDSDANAVSLSDEFVDATSAVTRDDLTTLISEEPTRLEVSYSPIRSSFEKDPSHEAAGYIVILRDVTTAKSLEEERDEFISVVSHELRTPIAIAEGTVSNAQVMLERKDISHDKVVDAVATAHEQIVFLASMVNDLSTLSRAERGAADEAEDIDVNELVETLYHEHESEAATKGLRFDLHLPAKIGQVHASRLYLKELLQNFITNAIKYTESGSIKLDVKRSRDGQVTFAVCDSGIGISRADQKRIFEKFYRAEDYRTRETSGTGLGLYVSQKLARKLGTHIDMKSRLNHGSTFSITLPLLTSKPDKKS